MGLFDRFRKQAEQIGKDKKPKHVVRGKQRDASKAADEEKRKQFAAVPAAGSATGSKAAAPKETVKAKAPTVKAVRKDDTGQAHRILLRAIVTEKSSALGARQQYVFAVATEANKIDIARAVVSLYGVRPQKVNVANVRGKNLRYGRTVGRTKRWKKAIVTLQPGQTMNVVGS